MILTCPQCSTKYVVKDNAIPDGGRQVRCAACKTSWHQDPEPADEDSVISEDVPAEARDAAEPVPVSDPDASVLSQPEPIATAETASDEDQWRPVDTGPPAPETAEPAEPERVEFEPYFHDEPVDEPRRGLRLVIAALLLAALAAVAFWFLAPASLKARVGLAEGPSELQVVQGNHSRQQLASGNTLLTVNGRIVNGTDRPQSLSGIRAEILAPDKRTVLYSWTIAAPARTVPPNSSLSFHSAELGVPDGENLSLSVRVVSGG